MCTIFVIVYLICFFKSTHFKILLFKEKPLYCFWKWKTDVHYEEKVTVKSKYNKTMFQFITCWKSAVLHLKVRLTSVGKLLKTVPHQTETSSLRESKRSLEGITFSLIGVRFSYSVSRHHLKWSHGKIKMKYK